MERVRWWANAPPRSSVDSPPPTPHCGPLAARTERSRGGSSGVLAPLEPTPRPLDLQGVRWWRTPRRREWGLRGGKTESYDVIRSARSKGTYLGTIRPLGGSDGRPGAARGGPRPWRRRMALAVVKRLYGRTRRHGDQIESTKGRLVLVVDPDGRRALHGVRGCPLYPVRRSTPLRKACLRRLGERSPGKWYPLGCSGKVSFWFTIAWCLHFLHALPFGIG